MSVQKTIAERIKIPYPCKAGVTESFLNAIFIA